MDIFEQILECEICRQAFDETAHQPRTFSCCGQSICFSCLSQFLQQFKAAKKFRCPYCKKENSLSENLDESLRLFPKNITAIRMMDHKKQTAGKLLCKFHGLPALFFCLQPECALKSAACQMCGEIFHSKCDKGLFVESGKFKEKLKYTGCKLWEVKAMKEEVSSQIMDQLAKVGEKMMASLEEGFQKISQAFEDVNSGNIEMIERSLPIFNFWQEKESSLVSFGFGNNFKVKNELFEIEWDLQNSLFSKIFACIFPLEFNKKSNGGNFLFRQMNNEEENKDKVFNEFLVRLENAVDLFFRRITNSKPKTKKKKQATKNAKGKKKVEANKLLEKYIIADFANENSEWDMPKKIDSAFGSNLPPFQNSKNRNPIYQPIYPGFK